MTVYIAPLVEGETEELFIPSLLYRVWEVLLGNPVPLLVLKPIKVARSSFVIDRNPELGRKVEQSQLELLGKLRRDRSGRGVILLMIDADDDCPKKLAPELLARAQAVRSDANFVCVIPKRMFENWFLAGASALAGKHDLPDTLTDRNRFEERNGARWLNAQYQSRDKDRTYRKTADPGNLIHDMDLHECRANAPSFDKLCRVLEALVPPPDPAPDAPLEPTA